MPREWLVKQAGAKWEEQGDVYGPWFVDPASGQKASMRGMGENTKWFRKRKGGGLMVL